MPLTSPHQGLGLVSSQRFFRLPEYRDGTSEPPGHTFILHSEPQDHDGINQPGPLRASNSRTGTLCVLLYYIVGQVQVIVAKALEAQ